MKNKLKQKKKIGQKQTKLFFWTSTTAQASRHTLRVCALIAQVANLWWFVPQRLCCGQVVIRFFNFSIFFFYSPFSIPHFYFYCPVSLASVQVLLLYLVWNLDGCAGCLQFIQVFYFISRRNICIKLQLLKIYFIKKFSSIQR